jgi:3D (Asp-Asp-Asp) domain-containing protein
MTTCCAYTKDIPTSSKVYNARVTFYSTDGRWGSRVADTKTAQAKEGVTVAAHPDFKFGTKVYIPALKGKLGDDVFIVQDRGSAVTKKRASRGRAYVFDVYVKSRSKVRSSAQNSTEYMKVYVIKA